MIALGRRAQRLALALAEEEGVGCFQSPALVDREASALIPDYGLDGAYLVGFGHTHNQPVGEQLFSAQQLAGGDL